MKKKLLEVVKKLWGYISRKRIRLAVEINLKKESETKESIFIELNLPISKKVSDLKVTVVYAGMPSHIDAW